MIKYYKNLNIQTKEQAKSKLDEMDAFVIGGTGKPKPLLDESLTKIWNQGKERLPWEWSEETQQEIKQKEQRDQTEVNKIAVYKSDLELWKDEKIRPIRDQLMFRWVDYYASKPLLWDSLEDNMKTEISNMRQTLLDWPAIFTKYVTDQTIESKKPVKPSYITE